MRDYLLTKINRFEHWLEAEASSLWWLPVRVLGYIGLLLLLIASNLVAVLMLAAEMVFYCLGLRKRNHSGVTDDRDSPSLRETNLLHRESIDLRVPIEVEAGAFDELVQTHHRVLIDIWAPWCGPCRMMKPALREVAGATGDRLLVLSINATTQPGLAKRFKAAGLPTLIAMLDGSEVGRHAGALNKDALLEMVHKYLPEA